MTKREIPWFIRDWLFYFENHCSISTWQRGKLLQRQGKVFLLGIEKEKIQGFVKGNEGRNVSIDSKMLPPPQIEEIELILSTMPSLLMHIYGKTLVKEQVEGFPFLLGFKLPQMEIRCSCHEWSDGFCPHIVALAVTAANEFTADFSLFLRFNGIDWDNVLMGVEDLDGTLAGDGGEFSLVPIPERPVPSFESRMGSLPAFWTSSFPFNKMLEEIYAKIREEAILYKNRK